MLLNHRNLRKDRAHSENDIQNFQLVSGRIEIRDLLFLSRSRI